MNNTQIKKISIVGVLSALAVILVIPFHFPIFPIVGFLEYDPADIPIFFVTSILGPWYGLVMTLVVSIVQGLTVSSSSGVIGVVMHIVATGSFVLAQGLITRALKKRNISSRIVSLISILVGIFSWVIIMGLWNLILTPIFMHTTIEAVLSLYKYIIGFNLIKASANGIMAFILCNALTPIISKVIKVE